MKTVRSAIDGVFVVEQESFEDHRGAFVRLYCEDALATVMGTRRVVQINRSLTRALGALRGLHFQHSPYAEIKLIRCLKGRVWDVAVDLRAGSATFLRWHAEELSEANARMLVVPEGCAHGFQTLTPDAELLYLHTAPYTRQAEGGVRYDDPRLAILWPLPVTDISARDRAHPLLPPDFAGLSA